MSDKGKLDKLISDFLLERRESVGGYAKIKDEDVNALYDIVHLLIELKCEPDADGDFPIEVSLINRLKGWMPYYSPIPYDGWQISNREEMTKEKATKIREEIMEVVVANLKTSVDRLDVQLKINRAERRDE